MMDSPAKTSSDGSLDITHPALSAIPEEVGHEVANRMTPPEPWPFSRPEYPPRNVLSCTEELVTTNVNAAPELLIPRTDHPLPALNYYEFEETHLSDPVSERHIPPSHVAPMITPGADIWEHIPGLVESEETTSSSSESPSVGTDSTLQRPNKRKQVTVPEEGREVKRSNLRGPTQVGIVRFRPC